MAFEAQMNRLAADPRAIKTNLSDADTTERTECRFRGIEGLGAA